MRNWKNASYAGVLLVVLSSTTWAQTAGMLSFQGVLKDGSGNPIEGSVNLEFRIYNAPSGGQLVDMDGDGSVEDIFGQDAKQQPNIQSVGGIVSTKFGPVFPGAFNGSQRWLEVRVNGSPLTRVEMATAVAIAEQINVPGTSVPVVKFNEGTQNFEASLARVYINDSSSRYPQLVMNDTEARGYGLGVAEAKFRIRDMNSYPFGAEDRLVIDGNRQVTVSGNLQVAGVPNIPGYGGVNASRLHVSSNTFPQITIDNVTSRTYHIGLKDGLFTIRDNDAFTGNPDRLVIDSNGQVSVRILQITGGSDLAESFTVGESGDACDVVEPGMVVAIDVEHPGQLVLANQPYDRKVAGVISGANGLSPGMVMKAVGQPHADGEQNVALTGRVWCWCDASFGTIEPGDRLTTSSTLGHAMKVTENENAGGAVIGKAMTRLAEGQGLVLMLVQPQ